MLYIQNLMWGILKEIPLIIIFFLILDAIGKKEGIHRTNLFFYKAKILSIIFILALTVNGLFNIEYIRDNDYLIKFEVFHDIINQLKDAIDWKINAVTELYGNVFLFVPLGFTLSYFGWSKKGRIWRVIIEGNSFSFIIELTQLICGRVFDFKDIMLNVCGVLIGYYIFSYWNQMITHFRGLDMNVNNKYFVKKIKMRYIEMLILLLMYIRMII